MRTNLHFMKRRATCIAILVIVVLCAAKLYGQVIYAMYGGDIPARWNPTLYLLSHKDLVGQLGRPDVDLAGKGYQYWQKTAWWGFYELQAGYADCCTDQSRPSSLYIAAYVKGKYDPVLYKKISKASVTTESGMEKASAKSPPQ
ncbi:hypothetical protein [Massilia rubra]|uniref:Uncharacterized protein n=1 Tax=Massilia rubra TaxID=2607910 RepID=A0ABX0LL75_9BURK|nr:hypothetical protein [Massilia rubra]NHZ33150.1 hypothetical protein [Massilia rubra]